MAASNPQIMFSNEDYEIRPAKNIDEYREEWWRHMQILGWNRGYHDLNTYMDCSEGSGMLLLSHKASRKVVGMVCAVVYLNSTGWLSFFIVDAEHRRKRMGAELFKCAMAEFERYGTKIIGLDGVAEQKATYERRGYVDSPLGTVKLMARPLVDKAPLGDLPNFNGHFIELRDVPRQLLTEHELECTGFERPRMWSDELMFNRPDVQGVALASTTSPKSLDDLHGWTLIRRSLHGPRIGPLYASSVSAAKAVLAKAMTKANAQYVRNTPMPGDELSNAAEDEMLSLATLNAEVWSGNPKAVKAFEDLGWKSFGVDFHRMWVGGKATPEFSEGGAAQKLVFATFDAGNG